MDDEFLDVEATKRVAHRAMVSAVLAFVGSGATGLPLPTVVVVPFAVIAIVVGVSAIRTLNHPEAKVIGGGRHLGIVLAALGIVGAVVGLAFRAFALFAGPGPSGL